MARKTALEKVTTEKQGEMWRENEAKKKITGYEGKSGHESFFTEILRSRSFKTDKNQKERGLEQKWPPSKHILICGVVDSE